LWILGIVLLVLGALAWLQFRWIDRVAQAERDRAKRDLASAVSNFERDFDLEITRVVALFEFPAFHPKEYSERYKQWLRLAPYPNIIRGVYVLDTGQPHFALSEVLPGEPQIRSTGWEQDLRRAVLPLQVATTSRSPSALGASVGVPTDRTWVRSWGFPNPTVLIYGDPAFLFPIIPTPPGPVTQLATRISGKPAPLVAQFRVASERGTLPSHWAVIVLDGDYLRSTLLPSLLNTHFQEHSGSETSYDLLVRDKAGSDTPRILYRSSSTRVETFPHSDAATGLFLPRLDCFVSTLSTVDAAKPRVLQFGSASSGSVAFASGLGIFSVAAENRTLFDADRFVEILRRRSQSCNDAPAQLSGDVDAPWELSVRYRAGSLDQAMAAFRRRNLLWSVGVISILAFGIAMLVVLTERARSLAQMQSEFVLGVSHELRTPLTVIRVAADNLRKGMVDNLEQVRKYGDIVATHACELSDMVEETLVFAHIQSESLVGNRAPVAPEEIIKSVLARHEDDLQNASIAVELQLAPRLPLIEVDRRLLERCLQNLIQNAIKYAAAGKLIRIRAEEFYTPRGDRVRVTVEDRGPGISSGDLPHIFEPFYRSKCSQRPAAPGMGLGLTLVKRVVEAHFGSVEVSSDACGSSFSLLLPPYREPTNRETT